MVSIPYIPDRGDIVKVDFGSKEITPDLVKRAFALQKSGLSFEDIAKTLNTEMQQGRNKVITLLLFCRHLNTIKWLQWC